MSNELKYIHNRLKRLTLKRELYKKPQQHPLIQQVAPFKGFVPEGECDYSGVVERFNPNHEINLTVDEKRFFQAAKYPDLDEEIFEWLDILDSILKADGEFVFVELGAGYGRWSARASKLGQRLGLESSSVHLITVEAEKRHSLWLKQNFLINEIHARHTHFECAVSNFHGVMDFYIQRPDDANPQAAAFKWYGQSLANQEIDGYVKEKVEVRRLTEILAEIPNLRIIDLIDLDLQGEDSKVLLDSKEILQSLVRKVHVGTDSKSEEQTIRDFFLKLGWKCVWDYKTTGIRRTIFGKIRFVDGVQTWTNPRLYK